MSSFFTLTKVLLKNGGNPFRSSSSKKDKLSLIILFIVFLPLLVGSTALFLKLYDGLAKVHLEAALLTALLAATCITMIVLGILYVISIYYFSEDTTYLLTMPIKPYKILAAKFIIVTIYQYFLELLILLPCLIAFAIKINTPLFWVNSLVVFLALPIIPNVVCSIISICIMAFSKFFKNKDRIKLISGLLSIAFAIGLNAVIQYLGVSSSKMKI